MSEHTDVSVMTLSDQQRRIIERARHESLAVLGAPGTGKTTLLVETVAANVDAGVAPEQILALAANRKLAAQLREQIASRLQTAVRGRGLGRTVASIAHEIVSFDRARRGEPAPRLLTGSQQDAILRDVIALASDPEGTVVRHRGELPWPEHFSLETPQLAGFRAELRELLAAMATHGVSPDRLRQLGLSRAEAVAAGQRHRALWPAVAQLASDYEDVLFSAYESSFDTANMVTLAATLIANGARPAADSDIRLVVVDDAQELTESGRQLLAAYERSGARIVTFGDPDVGTGVFHGGVPANARNWRDAAEPAPDVEILDVRHRHGETLSTLFAGFAEQIGVSDGSWQHRSARAGRQDAARAAAETDFPAAAAAEAGTATDEAALVAGYLRSLHLLAGVPWSDLAVIARSGGALSAVEQALGRAGIPTTSSAPVRATDDATVRAILTLGAIAQSDPKVWALGDIQRVLASELFGVDALKFRAIRRAMVLADIAAQREPSRDEAEPSDPLAAGDEQPKHALGADELIDPVALPGELHSGGDLVLETIAAESRGERHPIGSAVLDDLASRPRSTGFLAAAVRKFVKMLGSMRTRIANHDPLDTVLFEAWDDPQRNQAWQEMALSDSPEAAALNRRLDAVMALFDRAKRFVERNPDASLEAFLTEWHENSVVDDTLGASRKPDAVTLTTPAAAVGRSWRGVVVVGVNEGAWPNLRVRDTLLGAGRLAEALELSPPTTIIDRRRQVLYDESRMLLAAMSRASDYLLLTCVSNEESQPSPYLRQLHLPQLDSRLRLGDELALDYARLGERALIGHLRRELADTGSQDAAAALARLARAGFDGAHPSQWFAIKGRSTVAPLLALQLPPSGAGDEHAASVSLYPSSIKGFQACPLDWFVSSHAYERPSFQQTVGNIIHEALEHELEFSDAVAFRDWVHGRLLQVEFETDWVSEVQRAEAEDKALRLWAYVAGPEAGRSIGYEERMRADYRESIGTEGGQLAVEVVISGKIDRIETDEAGVRIIDFKTGRPPTGSEEADFLPQLAGYQLGYALGALEEPLQRVIEREGESKLLHSARLVFPGTGVREQYKIVEQSALSNADLATIRHEFAAIALQQHGILPAWAQEPNAGDGPSVAAAAADPLLGDPDAAPQFVAETGTHCTAYHGIAPLCTLHTVPEVTE